MSGKSVSPSNIFAKITKPFAPEESSQASNAVTALTNDQPPVGATGPDPNDATKKALQDQLDAELNIRKSMALVTGGQGIIGQPNVQSAGQSLLGM